MAVFPSNIQCNVVSFKGVGYLEDNGLVKVMHKIVWGKTMQMNKQTKKTTQIF